MPNILKLISAALLSALIMPADVKAADLYRSEAGSLKDAPSYIPPLSWTGFYLGANAGYGWSNSDRYNIEVFDEFGELYDSGPLPYELRPEGGFAGLQIGYNHQSGSIVLGIEADLQASDINDSSKTSFVDPGEIADFDYIASADVDWFGTVRGRLGYSIDRTLLYITGGFAYGEVNYQADYIFTDDSCCTGSFGFVEGGETKTGYVLGAGIEHMLDSNWSLKAEYQYIDLGSLDVDGALFFSNGKPSGETVKSKIDADFHTVRVGLNYRFDGAETEPLK